MEGCSTSQGRTSKVLGLICSTLQKKRAFFSINFGGGMCASPCPSSLHVCFSLIWLSSFDEQLYNKDPTYEPHMVRYLRSGLHHSHLITIATAHSRTRLRHAPAHTHSKTHTITRPHLPLCTCISPPRRPHTQLQHSTTRTFTNPQSPAVPLPLCDHWKGWECVYFIYFFPCCC